MTKEDYEAELRRRFGSRVDDMNKQVSKNSLHTSRNKTRKYEKPISLYPLKPEEALSLFMQVDPKKVKS